MKFQIFTRLTWRGRRHFWRLIAANHEIIAQSEGYTRRQSAIDTVAQIKQDAVTAPIIDEDGMVILH